MKLCDCIPDTGYLARIECRDKDDAVARMVSTLAEAGLVKDPAALTVEILSREIDASTAVGGGLAIPHGRSKQVSRIHMAVATLVRPLDMEAEDAIPVDVLILLVGPQNEPRTMLRALARLARLVKGGKFLSDLRKADSVALMRQAVTAAD